jgi:hypothetical protein
MVSQVAGGERWRRSMSKKKLARAARFIRRIAELLVPVLMVVKLLVEIANKAANCNDRELQIQISVAR